MKWPIFRDVLLFFGGMAGVVHETLLSKADRPTLLILFAAMMGLPAFLQSEAKPQWSPARKDRDSRGRQDIRRRHDQEDDSSDYEP